MDNNGSQTPVYVVLGATGLLGSSVSRRLAGSDARLVLAGRDTLKLERLSDELNAPAISLDASRLDHVEAALEQMRRSVGRLDGVVNCVGTAPDPRPITEVSAEEWTEHVDQNLTSAFATVRAAVQVMRETGGAVVLVAAWAARVGVANQEAFSAVKAGIIGLVRAAAAGYASCGLSFNCVAPGPLAALSDRQEVPGIPTVGSADDVASAIVWLLQPEQRWITGQVLGVDGGEGLCCR